LQPGDLVAWRLKNRGRATLDVTLLFIDSGYGIKAFFPKPSQAVSGENRFVPDQTHRIGPAVVKPTTFGQEHLVVIAVKADRQPIDFTCLEQPGLEAARERDVARGAGKEALGSPLGRLLQNAMYGRGKARGMEMVESDNHVLRLLSWSVPPRQQAGKP
jgi:hypothetical protein